MGLETFLLFRGRQGQDKSTEYSSTQHFSPICSNRYIQSSRSPRRLWGFLFLPHNVSTCIILFLSPSSSGSCGVQYPRIVQAVIMTPLMWMDGFNCKRRSDGRLASKVEGGGIVTGNGFGD